MKLLLWSPNDPPEMGHGDLPSYGKPVKLLRRILGLKDPLADESDAPRRPSLVERLDDIFAHDRTRLNEVLPEDIETTSSSEQGCIQPPVHAELDSLTEDSLSTELSPRSQAEIGQVLQTATVDAKESLSMPPEAMAVHSIDLAANEAAAQLQAAHLEMEASLKSHAEDYRKRLAELSSGIEEGLQRKSNALLEGFPGQLQDTLEGVQQKTEEVADELEKAAKDLLERSAKQLQEQADATLAALQRELKASRQGFIDEIKKQLTSMTQASLEFLTKAAIEECRSRLVQISQEQAQAARRNADAAVNSINLAAREAVAQLQGAQQETEASLKSHADDYRKRLAELAFVIEGLSGALQGLQQKITKEVADELEKAAQDLLNRSAKQLQGQADATVAALGEELRASRQGFIDEIKKQLTSMTQASLESLNKATPRGIGR